MQLLTYSTGQDAVLKICSASEGVGGQISSKLLVEIEIYATFLEGRRYDSISLRTNKHIF